MSVGSASEKELTRLQRTPSTLTSDSGRNRFLLRAWFTLPRANWTLQDALPVLATSRDSRTHHSSDSFRFPSLAFVSGPPPATLSKESSSVARTSLSQTSR